MNRLQKKYQVEVIPKLKEQFGYTNAMAMPRITKVTLNIGTSRVKEDRNYGDLMKNTLAKISGQRPVRTLSRKAISGFGIRDGEAVGLRVTLRKTRMYDFLDKLIGITLPRVKDFRGISEKSVDQRGNLSIGFKEHIAFPEIDSDRVEKMHGLEVNITVKSDNREAALVMYKKLGFPMRVDSDKDKQK